MPSAVRSGPGSVTKSALSQPRKQLVELMQEVNFGRILVLRIQDGEPVVDPLPTYQFERKFGAENGPRPELGAADFSLKRRLVELFDFFDKRPNGVIDVLEIQHGLPFKMTVTEVSA